MTVTILLKKNVLITIIIDIETRRIVKNYERFSPLNLKVWSRRQTLLDASQKHVTM